MLSPAAQHRLKASGGGRVETPAAATVASEKPNTARIQNHESVLAGQFFADLHSMGHIKSRIRRTDKKRHALERYQVWLDSFMERGGWQGRESFMFVWLLLWTIDVSEWRRGLQLAQFALAAGMGTPKDFSRNLAETVCEEIVGGILKTDDPAQYSDILETLAALVNGCDMTDQITAKLCKARGVVRLTVDPEKARELFLQALKLDPDVGVKRYLKALDNTKTPKVRTPSDSLQAFSLSATAAAKLANMTAPAFLRHAKKYPDLLPRVEIPIGKRTLYRFNPKHVRAYQKQHLIKTKQD